MRLFFLCYFLFVCQISLAEPAVCFSPDGDCVQKIINLIRDARHTVYMQSYTFTSKKIARALVAAKHQGVHVEVILDKSQFSCQHFSQRRYLFRHGIKIYEDDKPNIAHNKVIIVDDKTVETGSYNYTYSAERYNAENVLVLHDPKLAQKYQANWYHRKSLSRVISKDFCMKGVIY